MNFIDLCSGIGGFRLAFERSGNHCLLNCEIDKFAQQTYLANFSNDLFEKDITKIDEHTIPDFDILCGGFPCQAFSKAGKQKGFNDVRGTIFFDICRLLNHKRPKLFLLENVKNLRSHDKGNTFKIILEKLDELDYHHHIFLLNAKYFVPQNRERLYILGLDKNNYSTTDFNSLVKIIEAKYELQKSKSLPQFKEILEHKDVEKFTLSDKLWSFLQSHSNKHILKGNGFGYGLMNEEDTTSRTLTARYYKDGSEVLVAQKNKNPRKLTPRECARLMGFPDSFKITVSNTQAYKQFGNSVVVPVIEIFSTSIDEFMKNKS